MKATWQRTHECGALRPEHTGQTVRLNGWVHRIRDLGGLVFVDLRDRTGLVQVVSDPAIDPALVAQASDLRVEYCNPISDLSKEGRKNLGENRVALWFWKAFGVCWSLAPFGRFSSLRQRDNFTNTLTAPAQVYLGYAAGRVREGEAEHRHRRLRLTGRLSSVRAVP